MTPKDIELVKSSFAKVLPIKETAAELFYARLFVIAPSTRSMFKGDMAEQGRKLMSILAVAINGLDRFEQLRPAIVQLANRHVEYGVRPEHYETVGEALIWTLREGLDEAFTSDVEAAWTRVYAALSATMIEAAYPRPVAA